LHDKRFANHGCYSVVSDVAGNEKDGQRTYVGQRVDRPLPDDLHENNVRGVFGLYEEDWSIVFALVGTQCSGVD